MKSDKKSLLLPSVSAMFFMSALTAQTLPPPNLGEDTKGETNTEEVDESSATDSARNESEDNKQSNSSRAEAEEEDGNEKAVNKQFGQTTFKEVKRENGRVYLIELEHSSGLKQYIEETDSDGNIESEATDIEDTPNLPKWKLGSW